MLDNFHMLTSVICLQKSLFPAQGACPTFVDFAVDISRRSEFSKLWLSTLKLAMQICPFFVATSLQFVVLIFNMTILRFFPQDPPPPLWVSCDTWQVGSAFQPTIDYFRYHRCALRRSWLEDQVQLAGLVDVTSGLVDVTSGLVDVTSGLVDVTSGLVDVTLCCSYLVVGFHPLSKKDKKMTMDHNSTWSSTIWSHTPADYHTLLLLHVLNIPPTSRW